MSCYYFYLYDLDFGPAFVKICTYFPYPAKIWGSTPPSWDGGFGSVMSDDCSGFGRG